MQEEMETVEHLIDRCTDQKTKEARRKHLGQKSTIKDLHLRPREVAACVAEVDGWRTERQEERRKRARLQAAIANKEKQKAQGAAGPAAGGGHKPEQPGAKPKPEQQAAAAPRPAQRGGPAAAAAAGATPTDRAASKGEKPRPEGGPIREGEMVEAEDDGWYRAKVLKAHRGGAIQLEW
eukprot:gene2287-7211_t